ncbi:hypothetical protein JDV02_000448 [Purpureocillium takamizusanense]|uniref:Outer membrane protein, beta-barrel n=1 Tax=Purpureocillium takamizusanense TaxID=2060973 RepID=A0A9Q8Q7A5_9HYPO|nr:uncharacterized protein JDV02_000448 [Purpureocillium takamizusanense]UNI13732.1 hypothetical protein JDV02_000448 [Purpureocillium takamizusanense]
MATETETLSLPTTTAPTDVTAATMACLHVSSPALHQSSHGQTQHNATHDSHKRRLDEVDSVDWDTNITPGLRFPAAAASPNKAQCTGVGGSSSPRSLAACITDQRHTKDDNDADDDGVSDGGCSGTSVEESCKRALHHFPSPSITFPMPTLEFDFRIAVGLNPEPSLVENRVKKEITTISRGSWSGSFGNGRVMAGGYDLGQARGFRPIRIVEGAFVLQTTDEPPAVLEMRTRGSLSGPCDTLDALLSPRQPKDIDARQYGFRMFATVKTPDKRYAEIVNCGLWVASGVWHGEELIIDAYRVT